MLDFNYIKKEYPIAFNNLQQYFADGIGHCDVNNNVLWWYGDTVELDERIFQRELYDFFDSLGIYIVVKLDSMSSTKLGYFIYDVYSYNNGTFNGKFNQQPFQGNSREDAEDDAFDFAFEILNNKNNNE